MELKRKQIERFDPVYEREELIEVGTETVIPDSYSDVLRVAAGSANVIFRDKNASADRITFGGMCSINLLCVTENCPTGEIVGVTIPVSHVISAAGVTADSMVVFDASVIECSTSLINSRKAAVKVKIMLEIKVYNRGSLWLTTALPESDNMYCLNKEYCDEYVSFAAEKQLRLVENISLESEELKPFRWSAEFVSEDVKVIKGKVMVRGTCRLRVLFVNQASGELIREKYHLPFSSVVENDGFRDSDNIDVRFVCPYSEITANSTASGHMLNCDITTVICVTAKSQICEKVVSDVFHSRYELDTKWEKLNGIVKVSVENIKKEMSAVFENINNADKVYDFTYSVMKRVSGKNVYLSINLYIIYKDSMGDIYGTMCKYDDEHEMPNSFYDINVQLNDISVQCVENGSIRMDGEVVFEVCFGGKVEMEQVSACEILKDSLKTKKNDAALVLRKVAAGETVWDIAKRYNTSPDAIVQANKMEEPGNISGRLIMIPIVK